MEITLYRFDNGKVETVENNISPDQWPEKVNWVEIHCSNRIEVVDYLEPIPSLKEHRNYIITPENHIIPETSKGLIIQHFIISRKDNIYKGDYISLIISPGFVICIIPDSVDRQFYQSQPNNAKDFFNDLTDYFLFIMVSDIFKQNIANLKTVRERLNNMEEQLLNEPDKLGSSSVMKTRNDIRQLADIIEDQYVGFKILVSFLDVDTEKEGLEKLKNLLNGFKEFNRMVGRLEEKAESSRTQFMLIHQEESAHKINILTILQAIFIPLTFIAGVYGMNFRNIPELNWQNGYYFIWGSFVVLSGLLLIYFKKNGWFD